MKVFISIPMAGRSDEQIKTDMEWVSSYIKGEYPAAEILDSFIDEMPPPHPITWQRASGLWYLGKSLEIMSQARLAVFVDDWQEARGCVLEHAAATAYGIPTMQVFIP